MSDNVQVTLNKRSASARTDRRPWRRRWAPPQGRDGATCRTVCGDPRIRERSAGRVARPARRRMGPVPAGVRRPDASASQAERPDGRI